MLLNLRRNTVVVGLAGILSLATAACGSGGGHSAAGGRTGAGGTAGNPGAGGSAGTVGAAGAAGDGGKGGEGGKGGKAAGGGGTGGGGVGGGMGGGSAGPGGAGGRVGAAGGGGAGGRGGAGGAAPLCGTAFISTPGSLLSNGGFECPPVASGGYVSFSPGQQFFGWTVMGEPGQVSPLSGKYVNDGYTWPAHGGAQSIDLTGSGTNSATGVSQAITTVPGTAYRLSFWVGNLVAPGTIWGTSSTVNVLVDGAQTFAAVNPDGAGSKAITWNPFVVTFVATQTSTTVALVNGDPVDDNSNLLDDVVLSEALVK
jgi:hypothetical protein